MIERAEEKKPNQDMTENIKHMIADQIKALKTEEKKKKKRPESQERQQEQREFKRKRTGCYHCGNKNHEIRNCWIRYPELKKNRTDQSEKKDFKPFFKEKNNYQQLF